MSWGNHLRRFGDKTPLDEPFVLSVWVSRQNNAKHYRHYFDCDSADSQNLIKNNLARSANLETRPLRGAKNRNQASSSASADFLLEAEKRGTPPKSEKWQLLGNSFKNSWGERKQGGAALLRKETSENDGKGVVESKRDSSLRLHSAQNDNVGLDSANQAKTQNLAQFLRISRRI